ncbi:MAG: hypothetical protein ACKVU4_00345 [Phycisphaerales bacterium]
MTASFGSPAALARAGFAGFTPIHVLRSGGLGSVPESPGVYAVVRSPHRPPRFLAASAGGRWKGRDPTVAVERLRAKWVLGAIVLYIGQSGGGGRRGTLRGRLAELLAFGGGAPARHWGGRFMWQLAGVESASVCWTATPAANARDAERSLLDEFAAEYGALPFANLRRG